MSLDVNRLKFDTLFYPKLKNKAIDLVNNCSDIVFCEDEITVLKTVLG